MLHVIHYTPHLWITLVDKFFLFAILFHRLSKIFMATLNSQSTRTTGSQRAGSFVVVKLSLLIR